jgi:hypothetical protein
MTYGLIEECPDFLANPGRVDALLCPSVTDSVKILAILVAVWWLVERCLLAVWQQRVVF